MISGRDFVVLADDFNGLPTSTMHLFRSISRDNRVFWFNMVNRMPRLNRQDLVKAARVALGWGRSRRSNHDSSNGMNGNGAAGVHLTTPFMIPWFKPVVRRVNRESLLHAYRRLARRHAICDPVLFVVFPPAVDFVKAVRPALKIYYCYDEFLEYPGFNVADWRAMENDLLDSVDALVVTSRDLQRKNRRECPSLLLPHGVDFDHFHTATLAREPVAAMEAIRCPIVGFFGLIGEWVDVPLIARLSRRHPEVSFVLIGKSEVNTDLLRECRNVHQLGLVPYQDLPAYARYFNVGWIPFTRNKLTEAVNPLKLVEYFALGLPVVATRLPELENIAGPIRLASTETEFDEALREMLVGDSAARREEAVAVARNNTWGKRTEELGEFLETL